MVNRTIEVAALVKTDGAFNIINAHIDTDKKVEDLTKQDFDNLCESLKEINEADKVIILNLIQLGEVDEAES